MSVKDVRSRGTATDVARAFSRVKQRSHDLLKLNVDELKAKALRTPSIQFQPRHNQPRPQQDDETKNVVGQLVIKEDWVTAKQLECREEEWSFVDNDDVDDEDDAAGEGKC